MAEKQVDRRYLKEQGYGPPRSAMNPRLTIGETEVEDAWNITRELVTSYYPRNSGSEGASQAASYLTRELETFCSQVSIQEFTHRPEGFLKFLPIAELSFLLGILSLYYNPVVSLGFMGLTILMFLSQLLFYAGWFDFLFPRKKGRNVIGIIEPREKVEQQVILSGHYDAPYVFNLLEWVKPAYPFLLALALATLVFGFGLSLTFTAYALNEASIPLWLENLRLVLTFASVFTLIFLVFTGSKVSPGAGDNAVAVGIVTSAGRWLAANRLARTRVVLLLSDGEEAGLNGARAYLREFRDQFTSLPSFNFNLDVIYQPEHFTIFARDLNSLVKLDKKEAQLVQSLGKQYLNRVIPIKGMPLGGGATDAAEFAKAGISSVALVGLDFHSIGHSPYHQSKDTMEALSKEGIQAAIQLVVAYCQAKDQAQDL